MEVIAHRFAWESEPTQEIFWRYRPARPAGVAAEVDELIALCEVVPPARLLDVGCGLGTHLAELAGRGFVVTGIDVADYAVTRARAACAAHPACEVLKLRGAEMTWVGEFDLVYALEHTLGFMDPDELHRHLSRMCAAVKPGGWLLLHVPFTLEAAIANFPVHTWDCAEPVHADRQAPGGWPHQARAVHHHRSRGRPDRRVGGGAAVLHGEGNRGAPPRLRHAGRRRVSRLGRDAGL